MGEPVLQSPVAADEHDSTKPAQAAEPIHGGELDGNIPPLRALRAQAEVRGIKYALQLTGWNRKRAARLLRISYRGLLYKIRQHNISRNAEAS